MNIVIIEDEKITARDLARTLKSVNPDIDIVSILHNVEDAIDFFSQPTELDLIFSDIQLGDGLSFNIFERIDIQTPIIYCTAFDNYALEAFKTFGIDYILKPFTQETVAAALKKYNSVKRSFGNEGNEYAKLMSLLKQEIRPQKKTSSVIVQKGDKLIPLNGEDIAIFFIEHDAVFALTFDGKKHLLSHKLNALEEKFTPTFFRVNRQFLIHRKAVKDAAQYFNRKLLVNLHVPFKEQILVGKLKVTAFLNWLENT